MNNGEKLTQWAVREIEAHYRDEVCLLLNHTSLMIDGDEEQSGFSFYIPANGGANGLMRTFMIGGIGHDLFPMSWERIERMSRLEDYNTTCLADATVVYARSDGDRRRFVALQAALNANLANPDHCLKRAATWLSTAKEAWGSMLSGGPAFRQRMEAGYVCDCLALSVAISNGQFFHKGQSGQLDVLAAMPDQPKDFAEQYRAVLFAKDTGEQAVLCGKLIHSVEAYLKSKEEPQKEDPADFHTLALWYHEMSYTWRRVYHWCEQNDAVNVYLWCCYLQDELLRMGPKHGIEDVDLYAAFDPDDLTALRRRAKSIEQKVLEAVKAQGISLDTYESVDEFLAKNG